MKPKCIYFRMLILRILLLSASFINAGAAIYDDPKKCLKGKEDYATENRDLRVNNANLLQIMLIF